MKNALESANQLKEFKSGLSKFSGNEVLNPKLMLRIKGGTTDGGVSQILPPPTKP